jgi:tRNA (guanine26-N2/guanine27-N2)-dimethyltransferase
MVQIEISKKDANLLFAEISQNSFLNSNVEQQKPNVISIDPFGTPSPYISSAFNAIQRTVGLMCVTATDTAVLFGVRPNACIRKYMARPLHVEYCKEIGARILVYFLSRIANVNKLGIIPLLTFYANHFVRVFLLTFKGKKKISSFFKNYGFIIHCLNCGHRQAFKDDILHLIEKCPLCGESEKLTYAGPLWIGDLHEEKFLKELITLNKNSNYTNKKHIEKLLSLALDELNLPISYYNIHKLTQKLNMPFVPKIEGVLAAIRKKGYNVSRTHFDFLSIKTNMDIKSLSNCLLELVIN